MDGNLYAFWWMHSRTQRYPTTLYSFLGEAIRFFTETEVVSPTTTNDVVGIGFAVTLSVDKVTTTTAAENRNKQG